MTSSRKSMAAAIVLFVLIAGAIVGSMSWATMASYELARQNVGEEHRTKEERALRQIESHMMGIINSETARPFEDYLDRHDVRPDEVTTPDGRQLDPRNYLFTVFSDLALEEPPYVWMDLHFQVAPEGTLNSPQIPDYSWPVEPSRFSPEYARRARQTWSWLERIYPALDLRERVAAAVRLERGDTAKVVSEGDALPVHGKFGQQTLSSAQKGYMRQQQCVHPEAVAQNIRSLLVRRQPMIDQETNVIEEVTLEAGRFEPAFWLEPPVAGRRKLAFVRDYYVVRNDYADRDVYYQGFVGDWDLLKTELLNEIEGIFPGAELEPIETDAELSAETRQLKLPYLPAVLRVPQIPGGVSAAAWSSIRWQLLTSWVGAAAVLVIAGLGVRNLVALTNRRMQFAYAVTHELRTPLTTFRLYSDMLSAGLVPESAKQEYLDTLNRESMRLSRLVEEILEYARLENQKVRLHVTQTTAPELLHVVGETLEKACRHNGIEGRTLSHVPNGKAVRTDVNVVNQITGVLVNNACRHARSSEKPMVLVEVGAENGRLHVDVIDTGTGVDRADSRRIFKPFRRGRDADRAARGGIGLGLALARNWAKLLGGRLDLVSRHHPHYKGAHFRLTIPTDAAEN